ncbi:hypothetical protein ACHAXH_001989 [Discostella pseudostelligera]
MISSMAWFIVGATILILSLPVYTITLAIITILRAKWRHHRNNHNTDFHGKNPYNYTTASSPWSHIRTSLFQGTVFHIRHRPVIHAFKYPLYFAVVELDEASELFGTDNVHSSPSSSSAEQQRQQTQTLNPSGTLWPLSSLMLLRDIDHLKNGEGISNNTTSAASDSNAGQNSSMRERICNLVYERTNGKLDLRSSCSSANNNHERENRRKIILVTHLMYYGYCFNPVSLFFILETTNANNDEGKEDQNKKEEEGTDAEEIEAIVVEVSNTPWNEMSIYVLHPDSVDTLDHTIYPPTSSSSASSSTTAKNATTKFNTTTHRYRWRKNFHVSPFMTMDFDYDWKFQVTNNRIKVEATMIRRPLDDRAGQGLVVEKEENVNSAITFDNENTNDSQLYFTAGFDIQRTNLHPPTFKYPLQLAFIILCFPIYCFIIQLWIHYEAFKLLMKGVQFIPHPQGSETGASRAIAAVMRPIFGAMEVADVWWSRWKSRGRGDECKSKDA